MHGAFNVGELINDELIKINTVSYNKEYIQTKIDRLDGFKVGEFHLDRDGGLIRFYNKFGDIYEGSANKLGRNGFGRFIKEHVCWIGWWKNNNFVGNGRKYNNGKLQSSGWFEDMYTNTKEFNENSEQFKSWTDKASYFTDFLPPKEIK